LIKALENDGDGVVQRDDVGVAEQLLFLEGIHLGKGQGLGLAGLLDEGAAAQTIANGCCYGLVDFTHDVLLRERVGGATTGETARGILRVALGATQAVKAGDGHGHGHEI